MGPIEPDPARRRWLRAGRSPADVGPRLRPMPSDRKSQRSRTLKTGKILLDGGGVIDCQIRDVSDAGVRLRIATATPLPGRFRLQFVADGRVVTVDLKWQRGMEAGVQCSDPSASNSD